MKRTNNQLTAMCGVMIALAMVFSYLESLIPLSFAVPGIKIGLANVVTIIALQKLGIKPAIIISIGRVLLSGVLFSNLAMILYSLVGAFVSILVMIAVSHIKYKSKEGKRKQVFTSTGISICGAIAHNFGQILVAVCLMENIRIFYYMIVLSISGAIFGAVIGILAAGIMKNIKF